MMKNNQLRHYNEPGDYCLYLDDCRTPMTPGIAFNGSIEPWIVCRNYSEFCETIRNNGIPMAVSFDHDLAEEHMAMYFHMKEHGITEIDYGKFSTPTGLDCCVELFDQCVEFDVWPSLINIHSHNKYGRKVMFDYLAFRFQNLKIGTDIVPFKYEEHLLPRSLK